MPALPNVIDAMRVEYDFTFSQDTLARCREFFAFQPSSGSGISNAQAAAFATAISSSYGTNLRPVAGGDVTLTAVRVTDLTSPTGGFGEDSTARAGTRAGSTNIGSTAVLQSLHVARRYRGGHPRTYWPFLTQSDLNTAQTWLAASTAAVAAALAAHFTDWSTDLPAGIVSVAPINISYYAGFTPMTGSTGRVRNISKPRVTPITDLILSSAIQIGIASIRKRLLRLA